MTATLHDLRCDGSDCSCAVVYLVRETPTEGKPNAYTSMVGVSDESDTISRGPVAPAYSRTAGSLRTPGVRR
jgi:hypothetical protein